jgi:hypothetical protein
MVGIKTYVKIKETYKIQPSKGPNGRAFHLRSRLFPESAAVPCFLNIIPKPAVFSGLWKVCICSRHTMRSSKFHQCIYFLFTF